MACMKSWETEEANTALWPEMESSFKLTLRQKLFNFACLCYVILYLQYRIWLCHERLGGQGRSSTKLNLEEKPEKEILEQLRIPTAINGGKIPNTEKVTKKI